MRRQAVVRQAETALRAAAKTLRTAATQVCTHYANGDSRPRRVRWLRQWRRWATQAEVSEGNRVEGKDEWWLWWMSGSGITNLQPRP